MNPYDHKLRPDFQTDMAMPEWVSMGDTQTPDMSSFVDALKKRMTPQVEGGAGRSMAHLMHGGGTETGLPLLRTTDLGADAIKPPTQSGGMKSL